MLHAMRLFAAMSLFTPLLYGQFGSGLQGSTLDTTSAVLPGVRIVVTEVSTGVTRETVSSEVGVYRILGLSAGVYTVKALKEGFATAEQSSVTVALNELKKDEYWPM